MIKVSVCDCISAPSRCVAGAGYDALTRHGAITGVDGLVIATIRESVVIYGKLINPAYGAPGEPDIATSRPIWAAQGDPPSLKDCGEYLFFRSD